MPNYQGLIVNSELNFTRPDLLAKWAKKNEGLFFSAKLDIIGETKDPKTREQLGYYWGLLHPEIHKQLVADGTTIPVKFRGFERDIPITKDATHELLTGLCGQVSEGGASIRLSQMNKYETIRFVDNVLDFAIVRLSMNEENLKAWRMSE